MSALENLTVPGPQIPQKLQPSSKALKSYLEDLPPELKIQILSYLDTPQALESLLGASLPFAEVYAQNRLRILRVILLKFLPLAKLASLPWARIQLWAPQPPTSTQAFDVSELMQDVLTQLTHGKPLQLTVEDCCTLLSVEGIAVCIQGSSIVNSCIRNDWYLTFNSGPKIRCVYKDRGGRLRGSSFQSRPGYTVSDILFVRDEVKGFDRFLGTTEIYNKLVHGKKTLHLEDDTIPRTAHGRVKDILSDLGNPIHHKQDIMDYIHRL